MRKILLFLLLLLLFLSPAHSKEGKKSGEYALRVAYLIDGTGNKVKKNMVVVIGGSKIVQILPASKFRPQGRMVIDASQHTLLPGLIDTHVHLGGSGGSMKVAAETAPSFHRQLLKSQLRWGVTTVRSLCDSPDLVFSLRKREKEGSLLSPRIFAAGPAFTAPEGHPVPIFRSNPALRRAAIREVDSKKEARRALEKLVGEHNPQVIKIVYGKGNAQGGYQYPRLDTKILKTLLEESQKKKLAVTVHVDNRKEAQKALELGASGIEHAPYGIDKKLVEVMAKKKVAFTPTLAVFKMYSIWDTKDLESYLKELEKKKALPRVIPFSLRHYGKNLISPPVRSHFGKILSQTQKILPEAYQKGVLLTTGSDAGNPGVFHGPGIMLEIKLFVEAGLTPIQAIRCATLNGAKALGVEKSLGSIEVGKEADFVLVKGNLARDISALEKIQLVGKRGVLLHASRLDFTSQYQKPSTITPSTQAVDSFEDRNTYTPFDTRWHTFSDTLWGGKSKGNLTIHSGGLQGKYFLRLEGNLARSPRLYSFVAIQAAFTSTGFQTLDASSYRGLEFYGRSPKSRSLSVVLGTPSTPSHNPYLYQIKVSPKWKKYRIPFSSLYQMRPGQKKFRPSSLSHLRFVVTGKTGTFQVDLDGIRFYK